MGQVLKWQLQGNPQKAEKRNDVWLPHYEPDKEFLTNSNDCLVWLGHSSFFIRLDGTGLIIDPVMGNAAVVKRKIPFPFPEIGQSAHYVLVSHDHRDHCDEKSLRKIASENPKIKVLTGLQMMPLLSGIFLPENIEEAGWYQKFSCKPLDIWFLPSRHWSRRGLNDVNKRLWGGFLIRSGSKTIYFMGDSGYDTHFEDIGQLFPEIGYAIMGIGAYSPGWFMGPSHMNPEDSWKAFTNLGAQTFVPMHYGTFDLADEPLGEPIKKLRAVADESRLKVPTIGKALYL